MITTIQQPSQILTPQVKVSTKFTNHIQYILKILLKPFHILMTFIFNILYKLFPTFIEVIMIYFILISNYIKELQKSYARYMLMVSIGIIVLLISLCFVYSESHKYYTDAKRPDTVSILYIIYSTLHIELNNDKHKNNMLLVGLIYIYNIIGKIIFTILYIPLSLINLFTYCCVLQMRNISGTIQSSFMQFPLASNIPGLNIFIHIVYILVVIVTIYFMICIFLQMSLIQTFINWVITFILKYTKNPMILYVILSILIIINILIVVLIFQTFMSLFLIKYEKDEDKLLNQVLSNSYAFCVNLYKTNPIWQFIIKLIFQSIYNTLEYIFSIIWNNIICINIYTYSYENNKLIYKQEPWISKNITDYYIELYKNQNKLIFMLKIIPWSIYNIFKYLIIDTVKDLIKRVKDYYNNINNNSKAIRILLYIVYGIWLAFSSIFIFIWTIIVKLTPGLWIGTLLVRIIINFILLYSIFVLLPIGMNEVVKQEKPDKKLAMNYNIENYEFKGLA